MQTTHRSRRPYLGERGSGAACPMRTHRAWSPVPVPMRQVGLLLLASVLATACSREPSPLPLPVMRNLDPYDSVDQIAVQVMRLPHKCLITTHMVMTKRILYYPAQPVFGRRLWVVSLVIRVRVRAT